MKILKIIPIIIILTFFNSTSYAENCSDIKMNSSVNIIKKLKCKSTAEPSEVASEVATTEETEEGGKKKGILSKLFKKPTWMK